jgi:hypothetical protein
MQEDRNPSEDVLARLRPTLETIFTVYEIPWHQAEEIAEEACLVLARKWLKIQNPEEWLVKYVIDRCQMLNEEEGAFEDPPE